MNFAKSLLEIMDSQSRCLVRGRVRRRLGRIWLLVGPALLEDGNGGRRRRLSGGHGEDGGVRVGELRRKLADDELRRKRLKAGGLDGCCG